MDGTLAEIRMFAGTFPPRNWAFCYGQLLPISTNQALFSLVGTYYGGDGRNTFGLPDFRGRTAIGTGSGPGLTPRVLGQMYGFEKHQMSTAELAAHHHTATWAQTAGSGSGTGVGPVTINPIAVNDSGNADDPTNAYPAVHEPQADQPFSTSTADHVNMAPLSGTATTSVVLNDVTVAGAVVVDNTGSNVPFNIMQPWTCVQHIICIEGLYPSRN